MEEKSDQQLSPMDMDAIGEILNISMGSAATSASTLLDQKVNITTPKVEVVESTKLDFKPMEPAIGVEIEYVAGLSGKNIMIIKQSDARIMVGLMMQTEIAEEDFKLDELCLGAIGEVMNQMMGGSATALSQFLNTAINISPPHTFAIGDTEIFKNEYLSEEKEVVAVHFNLMIGELINSEFICLMPIALSKKMLSIFQIDSGEEQQAEESPAEPVSSPEQEPASVVPEEPARNPAFENAQKAGPEPRDATPEPAKETRPNYVAYHASFQNFDESQEQILPQEQKKNMEMMMGVPLQISVEIGRVEKKIRDIMAFVPGTVIELEKATDSQVDVYVNGQPTFKGDVVVVNDSYGVRITKIMDNHR